MRMAFAGAVAVLLIAPGSALGATQTKDCGAGNRIVYEGPSTIWPPNKAMWPLTITAKAPFGFLPVALSTSGTSDETSHGAVAPATDHDFGWGSAQTGHALRAERLGKGDGRVYTLTATTSFAGNPCTATFTAKVPHDKGKPRRRR